jgi:hypothetical protein
MLRMTLDPENDAKEQAVREALEDLRRVIQVIAHEGGVEREEFVLGYVDSVDHLLHVFAEDRLAFHRHANSGILWRNMGSIEDLSDRRIGASLVRLADAMNVMGLATRETLDDANRLRN